MTAQAGPRAFVRGLAVVLSFVNGVAALAAPSVPRDDSVVLERVPAVGPTKRLLPLRERLRRNPDDLQTAIALAKGYLEIGRETADPRFTSYAQATLTRWLSRSAPPPDAMVLGATALQSLHQFDSALVLLNRASAVQPDNAQAWLTLATIHQVQGRFDQARTACSHLPRIAGQLIAITCLSSVNSLTGHLAASYSALKAVYRDDARLPLSLRTWVLGQMAEMAVRLGDRAGAERHFRAGLAIAPDDVYLKADYADLLLLENRSEDVVQLLRNNELQDNLLLRLAVAAKRADHWDAKRWAELFQARYEAARRDQDVTHLREQARFILEVAGDATEALKLAEQNWAIQREPADVRIFVAAADAARNADAQIQIREWIRATRYEDHVIGSYDPRTALAR